MSAVLFGNDFDGSATRKNVICLILSADKKTNVISEMTVGSPVNGRVSNRSNVSHRQSTAYYTNPHWNDSQPNLLLPNQDAPIQAKYPHIKDLQAKADGAVKNIDPRIPV